MNSVLTFLSENWQRFGLEAYGPPGEMNSVLVTPRFHASSHVVFLIVHRGSPQPVLVAKVPRLPGDGETLVREAANLLAIQANRDGGFDSIPRVIVLERRWERPVLVETALVGRPLDPAAVRRDPGSACKSVIAWLVETQSVSRSPARLHSKWFERLIVEPFSYLERNMVLTPSEGALLERTWRLAEVLPVLDLPLVVEHGDLSHPNLLLCAGRKSAQAQVGVVDWEVADVHGLPGCDLFFFLTYVAFALNKARENRRFVAAFHEAYFGAEAWAMPYVGQYVQKLGLPTEAMTPLFVLTWVRYLAGLLVRLDGNEFSSGEPDSETIAWLRGNRYYALWRHAMEHLDELDW